MGVRRWVVLAIAAVAATLLAARGLAELYTDYAWYRALDALEIWKARMGALVFLRLIGGGAASAFAFANFYAVRQSVVSLILPRRVGDLEFGEEVSSRRLTGAALVIAVLTGIALCASLEDWSGFILARTGIPFRENDPFFNADLGFFVYRLPFEQTLFAWSAASVLCVSAVVVLLYVLTPGLRWEKRRIHVSEYVRRHLGVLGGILTLLLAWHFRLGMYELLSEGSGPNGAFTYVDHVVGVPGHLVLAVATLATGLIVIWAGFSGQRRLAVIALAGVLVTGLVTNELAPAIAGRVSSDADSAAHEGPYEATRAGYSRRAFATDRILFADSTVVYADMQEAALGVPVWDGAALERAIEAGSPVGRGARLGWESRAEGIVGVISSPQQPPAPGEAAPVGIVVRAWASETGDRGVPSRVTRGASDDDAILLPPALVLDSARGYAVVADTGGRLAGMPISSSLPRLAYALSVQNLRLWWRDLPEPHPTLLTVRSVRERVDALVPFFAQGSQVTPVVVGDSLYWSIDLYSASATYPLSRSLFIAGERRSYFQHAGMALVLASTGEVRLVADRGADPVAATWFAMFPRLFVNVTELPLRLALALPPPIDGARAQALAYGFVGMRANEAPQRHAPVVDGGDSALAAQLPVFALPHQGPTALEIPLLDQTERVRGVLVVEGGLHHRTFWLEIKDGAGHWPTVLERLRAADSLARTSNATVVRGVVRTFALHDGLAYVQPVYRWSPAAAPVLAHVVVLAGDSVRVVPTLRRTGRTPVPRSVQPAAGARDDQLALLELYQTMREALRRGDWVAFGLAFDALGALLARSRP